MKAIAAPSTRNKTNENPLTNGKLFGKILPVISILQRGSAGAAREVTLRNNKGPRCIKCPKQCIFHNVYE